MVIMMDENGSLNVLILDCPMELRITVKLCAGCLPTHPRLWVPSPVPTEIKCVQRIGMKVKYLRKVFTVVEA